MESLGSWNRPRFQTTLHPDYSDDKPFVFTHKDYSSVGDADGTGFHVYTVEKKKGTRSRVSPCVPCRTV